MWVSFKFIEAVKFLHLVLLLLGISGTSEQEYFGISLQAYISLVLLGTHMNPKSIVNWSCGHLKLESFCDLYV